MSQYTHKATGSDAICLTTKQSRRVAFRSRYVKGAFVTLVYKKMIITMGQFDQMTYTFPFLFESFINSQVDFFLQHTR